MTHSPRALRVPARALAVTALALALASMIPSSAPAAPPCASGTGHRSAWTCAWRPGWLPGDPAPAERASLFDATSVAGLWIALDPVTRRPTAPTAEQRRAARAALAPAAPEMDETLPVERIPGGGELIHLNGRHQVFSVARRDASGRFTTGCASDSAAASRVLAAPPAPVRQWEEK